MTLTEFQELLAQELPSNTSGVTAAKLRGVLTVLFKEGGQGSSSSDQITNQTSRRRRSSAHRIYLFNNFS